jgi:hypothetical protein
MKSARIVAMLLTLFIAACSGSRGDRGEPGLSTGALTGTVKDPSGLAISGASVSTAPATSTVQTDNSGSFSLSPIPIGAYTVSASKSGYATAQVAAVGVAAGATNQVNLVLAPVGQMAAISGTVLGRSGIAKPSSPVAGATVCVQSTTALICATSQSDGTYSLPAVPPGPVFLSASATGFLPGETREAVFAAAGVTSPGVTITLSGQPGSTATYIGAGACVTCHSVLDAGLVSAWQHSAHGLTVDRTLATLDVSGWPAEPADCTAPATADTGLTATDPAVNDARAVFLVRWKATCPGKAAFAMALDTNQNGTVDATDTLMPVAASQGGVATDAGQCGQGGIIPAGNPCAANYLASGATAAVGWWQQEYLMDIAAGPGKPVWVTWDLTATPKDSVVLPVTWNQRTHIWAPAPDYNPTQAGTFARVCTGCHDTSASLSADANGNVTAYTPGTQTVACERCHGPGSDHAAASGAAQLIINPAYITAQAQNDMCGQCHSNGAASAQPVGAFDFAFNSQATQGGGSFIPGVHTLTDFVALPPYGDPGFYYPGGIFSSIDHISYVDLLASPHANNPYQKVTCSDCHESHDLIGGPYQFARRNAQSGDQFVFQQNATALHNDVVCLGCHATHGPFATVTLEDTARYHLSVGGVVQKNGAPWVVASGDQQASATVVADAVNAHMLAKAGMPAYFDPMGAVSGQPVGRCSSCHMAKTAITATFFAGPDASGRMANIAGDTASHTFRVAWPQDAIASANAATSWDGVMPNACGSCHAQYRFGK